MKERESINDLYLGKEVMKLEEIIFKQRKQIVELKKKLELKDKEKK